MHVRNKPFWYAWNLSREPNSPPSLPPRLFFHLFVWILLLLWILMLQVSVKYFYQKIKRFQPSLNDWLDKNWSTSEKCSIQRVHWIFVHGELFIDFQLNEISLDQVIHVSFKTLSLTIELLKIKSLAESLVSCFMKLRTIYISSSICISSYQATSY